jgi:death-on-curing protein
MVEPPSFLTLDEVLAIHADQLERYGGLAGLRDRDGLLSALGMPSATFEDTYLHGDVFEMAAAYLFHLARNHPFVDGNKRTALMTAIVFLAFNGEALVAPPDDLTELVLGVAEGSVEKSDVAVFLRRHAG